MSAQAPCISSEGEGMLGSAQAVRGALLYLDRVCTTIMFQSPAHFCK